MFRRLELRLKRLGLQIAAAFAAVILLLTAVAFLTVAAWIALAHATNHSIAALILGGLWLCLGITALALAIKFGKPDPRDHTPDPTLAMASAFLTGFTAAKRRD